MRTAFMRHIPAKIQIGLKWPQSNVCYETYKRAKKSFGDVSLLSTLVYLDLNIEFLSKIKLK